MLTCEQCREGLFDLAFGLLEGDELQAMREHLRGCMSCQAALAQVETQQVLLARAAKAIPAVAEFTLPAETGITANPTPASAPLPVTLPASDSKRPLWRRPIVAWVSAVAVLIVVGLSFSYYKSKLDGHRRNLAKVRKEHNDIDADFASLPAKYASLQKNATAELRFETAPYVHVVGPTQLQPNAKANLYITTLQPDGAVAKQTALRVVLKDAQTDKNVFLARASTDDHGKARVELDASAAKAGGRLNVVVEADIAASRSRVEGSIHVQAPTYVTRIDTNKALYQLNDLLFFRVLVLDRFSLMPPAQTIWVRVALRNKDGVVAQLERPTAEGGIVAQEFPIGEKFPPGTYTLTVEPLYASQTPVQPASHRIEVVRDLRVPDLVVDPGRYLPGDEISGTLRGGGPPKSAKAHFGDNKAVDVTLVPETQPFGSANPQAPAPPAYKVDNAKSPSMTTMASPPHRFAAKLPTQLPPGVGKFLPFTLEVETAKTTTKYEGVVPLEPTEYDVDFYPEGGDLIAGVPNRVYYRVRAKSGEPFTGDGHVILMTGKDVIADSKYELGLGYLDFIPDPKEEYTLRITSPVGKTELKRKLTMRRAGVVLHLPTAVGKQGEPIKLTLRNQGPPRKLLLVAQCRGQVVDQRWLDIKTGSQDTTLAPTRDARGMIKVTAYEVAPLIVSNEVKLLAGFASAIGETVDSVLTPIAERLAYRTPVQKLDLSVTLSTQQPLPGKNMIFSINALTEKREPANNWILASVVDERFLARSRSLSAHFMLLNEIRAGSELEDAQVVLHDSPASADMLERFLGTHGWRRFIPTGQAAAATPLVFSRENRPLEDMHLQYQMKFDAAMTPLRLQAFGEEDLVRTQRMNSAIGVQIAAERLNDFEDRVQVGIRMTVGVLFALLLLASIVMMLIGILRIARQSRPASLVFGGAFGCLAVCLGVLLVAQALGPIDAHDARIVAMQDVDGVVARQQLQLALAKGPGAGGGHFNDSPFATQGALRASLWDNVAPTGYSTAKTSADSKSAALYGAHADRAAGIGRDLTSSVVEPNVPARPNAALEKRRKDAEKTLTPIGKMGQKTDKTPPAKGKKNGGDAKETAPQPAPPLAGAKDDVAKALASVEYAHPYAPGLYADTLLWHPALWIANGSGEISFDIGSGQSTYRVLLLGHNTTGRFGFFETRLDVLPVEGATPRAK